MTRLRSSWSNLTSRRRVRAYYHSLYGDAPGWERDLEKLSLLSPLSEDTAFRDEFAAIKQANKDRLAAYLSTELGVSVRGDSMFDVQIKRIHELIAIKWESFEDRSMRITTSHTNSQILARIGIDAGASRDHDTGETEDTEAVQHAHEFSQLRQEIRRPKDRRGYLEL